MWHVFLFVKMMRAFGLSLSRWSGPGERCGLGRVLNFSEEIYLCYAHRLASVQDQLLKVVKTDSDPVGKEDWGKLMGSGSNLPLRWLYAPVGGRHSGEDEGSGCCCFRHKGTTSERILINDKVGKGHNIEAIIMDEFFFLASSTPVFCISSSLEGLELLEKTYKFFPSFTVFFWSLFD